MDMHVKREEDEPGFEPAPAPSPDHVVALPAMTQLKKEEDEPGYEPAPAPAPSPSPDHVVALPETSAIDEYLVSNDFTSKICLVKLGGMSDKLWPALKFEDIGELQEAVENDVQVSAEVLARLQGKISVYGQGQCGRYGIAYLLGRSKVKRSLVALTDDEGMVVNYFSQIGAINKLDEYQGDAEFQKAFAITMKRIKEQVYSDDDSTVALSSPIKNEATVMKEEEVIVIADSPAQTTIPEKAEEKKKRKGGGGEGGEGGQQKKKGKQTNKNQGKTPKSKAKKAPSSIVTPAPSKRDIDKRIAESISPVDQPYSVMPDTAAWQLLQSKFGLTCVGDIYFLPSQEKPVASKLANLRKDLCEHGLPEHTVPLSEEEKVNIARWVRYAHVAGRVDGQQIRLDDLGVPINKFMEGWKILCDKFGCRYSQSSAKYIIPTSPSGGDKKVFEHDSHLRRHFAQFGIQCIPDEVSNDVLNKNDRLSLDIYFASPPITVLNTFERIEKDGSSRRKRRVHTYRED